MSLIRPTDSSGSGAPAPSLAARRPGHEVMHHLLQKLEEGSHGTRVPLELQSWYAGAQGEIHVGQELATLSSEWQVFHSIPAGRTADIDHLLIGPPGIFVINTKCHRGSRVRVGTHAVWINGGQENGYQRSLLNRTAHVRALLEPRFDLQDAIRPLLVFVDAASLAPSGPQEVDAVTSAALVSFLSRQPARISAGLVHAIAQVVSRPETWSRPRSVLDEPDPTPRFLSLSPAAPTRPSLPAPQPSRDHAGRRPGRRRVPLQRVLPRVLGLVGLVAAPVLGLIGLPLFVAIVQMLAR